MKNKIDSNLKTQNPSGLKVIAREIRKDKLALLCLGGLVAFILFIVIANIYIRVTGMYDTFFEVNILNSYEPPGGEFILGTDAAGRSLAGWLMIGSFNSLVIGIAVTVITTVVGLLVGLVLAYYGGRVDNIAMRMIDFISLIPTLLFIIVFVSISRNYGVVTFVLILSCFAWIGTARLVRSKALSEARRDYVYASKTMGTSDLKIMFKGILPNISSIIVVDTTLTLAGNIGIETSLSFLGFGLPAGTPSLGTLIAYASDSSTILDKMYLWIPAALVILFLMLCINYVGQALRRSLDARQRL